MEIIETYPDKPWDWRYISCNPYTTYHDLKKMEKPIINYSILNQKYQYHFETLKRRELLLRFRKLN